MITIFYANTRNDPKNCKYPNKLTDLSDEALKEAFAHDYVCAEYKGSYRNADNFVRSTCLAFDVDNDHSEDPTDWLTPEDVRDAFPGVEMLIHFSRSHMKAKNGRMARPKFHVFFPIEECRSAEEYAGMKQRVYEYFPYFDAQALDITWLTLRGPSTENYSLSKYPGFLKLTCADALLSQRGTPAAVLRRIQHHCFEASTRMYFRPDAGRQAGMTLFKDERHYLWFYVGAQDGNPYIALQNIGAGAFGSEPVFIGKFKFIDLKIVSDGQTFAFWYALDGKSWTLFQEIPARPLSTIAAGGFTGTTVGLYAGRL